jgi:hypothetical protein
MLAGFVIVLNISIPIDLPRFKDFLSHRFDIGKKFSCIEQYFPHDLVQAFIDGYDSLNDNNIFYGYGFEILLLAL